MNAANCHDTAASFRARLPCRIAPPSKPRRSSSRRSCRRRRNTSGRRWPRRSAPRSGSSTRITRPSAPSRRAAPRCISSKLMQREPRLPRRHHRHARQSRPGGGPRRAPLQTTRHGVRAARQQRGEERRDARARRDSWSSTATISRRRAKKRRASARATRCTWCRRSIPTSCSASRSYWAELFRAAPDLDVVYVPIGQGSGICAAAAARNAYSPRTQIVGVVSAHAPAFSKSFAARAGGRSARARRSSATAWPAASRMPDALAIMLANVEPHRRSHRCGARGRDARASSR